MLRPFPKVATGLYQLAAEEDAGPPLDDTATMATLPASARRTSSNLQATMRDTTGSEGSQLDEDCVDLRARKATADSVGSVALRWP